MTKINYNTNEIDFGNLDAFFLVEENYQYLMSTFELCRGVAYDVIMPLNPSDANYFLFVKSLVYINEKRLGNDSEFSLEFNSEGRPFQKMKKIFSKKVVRSYNNTNLAPLSEKQESTDMAKEKTEVPAVKILLPETVNKSFEQAKAEVELRVSEALSIIEINDDKTAKVVMSILKNLKGVSNNIEKVRKAQKAPYIEAGKMIEDAANVFKEQIDPQLKRLSDLSMAWDKEVAKAKAIADAEADKKRQEENQKVIDAQLILDKAKEDIVKFEAFAAGVIVNETDRDKLLSFWKETLKPFDPNVFAEVLRPEAEAMKARLTSLGVKKDALMLARTQSDVSHIEVATHGWDQEMAKYAHLKTQAEVAIEQKVSENINHVALNAELNKSAITSTQIANTTEKSIATRKTWKYRVVNMDIVPSHLKVTTINEDAMKQVMKDHKAEIEAGLNGCPGIEFYCEESAVIRA